MQPAPTVAGAAVVAALTLVPGSARASAQSPEPPWDPPLLPMQVTAQFDRPEQPWLPGHRGVDLGADAGNPVRAPAAGYVSFAGVVAGRGVVTIDHGGLRTSYEPADALVVTGERVTAGQAIATVGTGAGHCGSGGCLHLGLRRGDEYLDPLLLFTTSSARLLPW